MPNELNPCRDRLIELIAQAKDEYPTVPLVNGMKETFQCFLADHLLANGVIVPPDHKTLFYTSK